LLLDLWGNEIIAARELRDFEVQGLHFPSASSAVLWLAETELEEASRVAWNADKPSGPPIADADLWFEEGGALIPFKVDRWYRSLPALCRHFSARGDRWKSAKLPSKWDTGLRQELLIFRSRPQRLAQEMSWVVGPIGQPPSKAATLTSGADSQPQLRVQDRTVYLDGRAVPLDFTPERTDDALAFLGELLKQPGNWMSSADIGKATHREGLRFDRVFRDLPTAIKSQLESNRRKGYRVRPLA
jgi:hypothetical protein